MEFSVSEFESIIQNIEDQLEKLGGKLADIPDAVADAIDNWWVNDLNAKAIRWAGNTLLEFGTWVWNYTKEIAKGWFAPIYMAMSAWDWAGIRSTVSQVAGNVQSGALPSTTEWKGSAQEAYKARADLHSNAGKRVSEIGLMAMTTLGTMAVAGLVFYAAILAALAKVVAAIGSAIIELCSGVFAWAAVLTAIEETLTTPATYFALVTAITALAGAEVGGLIALKAAASDNAAFPNGKWPTSNSESFSDATRLDGDADWSVK